MSRGSLEDILHKSDAKINFSKKIQFAIDICNGMAWISGRDVRIIYKIISFLMNDFALFTFCRLKLFIVI